jgi:hypothetical protein
VPEAGDVQLAKRRADETLLCEVSELERATQEALDACDRAVLGDDDGMANGLDEQAALESLGRLSGAVASAQRALGARVLTPQAFEARPATRPRSSARRERAALADEEVLCQVIFLDAAVRAAIEACDRAVLGSEFDAEEDGNKRAAPGSAGGRDQKAARLLARAAARVARTREALEARAAARGGPLG